MRARPRHVPLGDRKLSESAPNLYSISNGRSVAMSPTPSIGYAYGIPEARRGWSTTIADVDHSHWTIGEPLPCSGYYLIS